MVVDEISVGVEYWFLPSQEQEMGEGGRGSGVGAEVEAADEVDVAVKLALHGVWAEV